MIEYPICTKRFIEILTKDSFYCGFIKDSLFYVGIPFGNHGRKIIILDFEKLKETKDETLVYGIVPVYDEWKAELASNDELLIVQKRLERRIEIATKALKEYDNGLNWDIRGVAFMKYNKGFTIARKALKEMEGVK